MNFSSPKEFVSGFSFYDIDSDDSGVHCKFIKVTNEVGIKVYESDEMALTTYLMQEHLATKGLAPKCWGYDEDKESGMFYYFTEIVEIANDIYQACRDKCYNLGYEIHDYLKATIEVLKNQFAAMFGFDEYDSFDFHLKNWGFLNGVPVIIDISCDTIEL
jgi:hypothetical protein